MPTNMNPASTTRATRSRYSSPQLTPSAGTDLTRAPGSSRGSTPAASIVDGNTQQSFMQRWLDPKANKKAKASYQDAALMRHGVVDNMAPVGGLPKLGTFKKASVAAPPPPPPDVKPLVRTKIILKRSSTADTTTPTPTPAPAAAPTAPAAAPLAPAPAPEEDETEDEEDDYAGDESHYGDGDSFRRRSVKSKHDDMDQEYTPNKKSHKSQSRRSMSRMSGGRNGSISSASFQQIPLPADRHAKLKAVADEVVTQAVDEAIAHCRYPTAYALRTLYDEKCNDRDFVSLVVRVCRQQADAEDLNDFGRLMALRKREGRKEDKGYDYFEPPSSDRRLAPHRPKPAPYRHLVKMDLTILHQNTKPEKHIIKADHGEQPSASASASAPAPASSPSPSPTPAPAPAPAPESEATASPPPSLPPHFSPEPAPVPESESAPPQPEPVHPPSPSPAPSPAPSPTPEPPVAAPEPPVVAPEPSPAPAPQQSTKRELPEDDEAQGEPEVDAHVRKKRRSNRHSGGTRTMANGVQGKPKTATPSKRRTRGTSQSSTSSLSSAQSVTPPASIQPDDADEELPDATPSRQSPTPEERPATPVAEEVSTSLPILKATGGRKGRRSVAARKSINGNVAAVKRSGRASKSTSTTPATSKQPTPAPVEVDDANPPGQPFEMPEALNEPLYPHHANPKRGGKGANGGLVPPSKIGRLDDNDEKWRLRKSARAITNSYMAEAGDEVSFVRPAPEPEPQPEQENQEREAAEATTPPPPPSSRARTSLPTSVRPGTAAANARSTRSSRKRSHDDLDEQPSPTTLNFGPPEAGPGTAATSRAGTPVLRPAKKPRTGLRVKNSPMKRKSGTSAGIPRASGERGSPGAPARDKEDDNDDYCSSCSGSGELICCDGCTRSFHFSCVDPPLSRDSMPVEWFCNVCRTERELLAPEPVAAPGPPPRFSFRPLVEKLDARNSSAFRLPVAVRDRFEGVRTGVDGEYEEVVPVTKGARKKKSDDEVPDLFRLRDADGNPVICHACQQSSGSTRAIIPCGLCGLHWHLDCLDPPMANPPSLKTWKCPCHIEDILGKVSGPAHKYRKIKASSIIEPLFTRGYINNGYIDVELEEEDDNYWKNVETYGRTVRLPEKGIKLDFLSRARENRKGKPIPPLNATVAPVTLEAPCLLSKPSLEHQQAAYNLAQLSGQGTSAIDTLVDTLIAEAQPEVVSMIARVDSSHVSSTDALSSMDKQGLRAILAQMEQMRDHVRSLLGEKTPEGSSPQLASSSAQEQAARVPSLTHSQTTRAESENPAIEQPTPRSPRLMAAGSPKSKNLPSPAATECVLAASGMDEDTTLTLKGGSDGQRQSRSPSEENATAGGNAALLPATPTDVKVDCQADGMLLKGDKTAVEIDEDAMDLY